MPNVPRQTTIATSPPPIPYSGDSKTSLAKITVLVLLLMEGWLISCGWVWDAGGVMKDIAKTDTTTSKAIRAKIKAPLCRLLLSSGCNRLLIPLIKTLSCKRHITLFKSGFLIMPTQLQVQPKTDKKGTLLSNPAFLNPGTSQTKTGLSALLTSFFLIKPVFSKSISFSST
jgi:hypothetical protein